MSLKNMTMSCYLCVNHGEFRVTMLTHATFYLLPHMKSILMLPSYVEGFQCDDVTICCDDVTICWGVSMWRCADIFFLETDIRKELWQHQVARWLTPVVVVGEAVLGGQVAYSSSCSWCGSTRWLTPVVVVGVAVPGGQVAYSSSCSCCGSTRWLNPVVVVSVAVPGGQVAYSCSCSCCGSTR